MFNYVRLSDGGPARHVGPRSEVQVVSQLAVNVLGKQSPVDWQAMQHTGNIRSAMSRIIPGYEAIGQMDATKQEFLVSGRTFYEPTFATPSGRAKLHVHDLPELDGGPDQLRLMTVRSEGQFNTVVYEEYDLYRGQDRRDIILLHPSDIERLGLAAEQGVTVRSEAGAMPNILVRPFEDIRAGNALMYYPEANVLVPRRLDPLSKTPAFKCVLITIEPSKPPVAANASMQVVQPNMVSA
jgi:anaerobic selenocysteine-containing dehydrogenase